MHPEKTARIARDLAKRLREIASENPPIGQRLRELAQGLDRQADDLEDDDNDGPQSAA
jgi:hypothetical protein